MGSDQAHQKITGPSLIGLEQAKTRAIELIDSALEELEVFDMRGQPLAALARYMIERKK